MGRLVVLGSGESGIGAAKLARQKDWEVLVSDKGSISKERREVLSRIGASWEDEGHTNAVMQADLIEKSPGIPDHINLIKELKAKTIPVISEIEFAARYTAATIIAITGSNGKTTTATLIQHVLQRAKIDSVLAGNVGSSFAGALAEREPDVFVLELSSFQLDGIVDFRPHIAILLNITPDHLDRYDYEIEKYADSKFRIGMNQQETDYFIYSMDDPITQESFERNPIAFNNPG
ncbi:UNVERIFIED_CONTAM: hypothetical protein GTU68_061936 [Idotea baltica]|nr:hypothetical protein [Idotea baltica]